LAALNVKYVNTDSANIVFEVLVLDSIGDWQHVDFNYTSMKQGAFNVRGFPPVERTWGIYARDRWDNHSDTLRVKIRPIYEEALDKTKFNDVRTNLPILYRSLIRCPTPGYPWRTPWIIPALPNEKSI
jgi:hypothetical protein